MKWGSLRIKLYKKGGLWKQKLGFKIVKPAPLYLSGETFCPALRDNFLKVLDGKANHNYCLLLTEITLLGFKIIPSKLEDVNSTHLYLSTEYGKLNWSTVINFYRWINIQLSFFFDQD